MNREKKIQKNIRCICGQIVRDPFSWTNFIIETKINGYALYQELLLIRSKQLRK